jgi:dipeptidyl aminopeptidase/acylaminoacyl peptidase
MAKRRFKPEDAYRLRTATDPTFSPDGKRVAWVQSEVDEEEDRGASSIWVAPADGSAPPRPFTEGPLDHSPRWSPDGRFLAYVSAPGGDPLKAHLRLAPLDGGAPRRLGHFDGPVSQPSWSPDSTRLVVVSAVGVSDPAGRSAAERNAPRRVRGLAARLDGFGWYVGRRHLFVVDVADGTTTQVTKGEFDHADPGYSPDGTQIVFASDRDRRRDDRQFRAGVCLIPTAGGPVRKLTDGNGSAAFPTFSPDGSRIAFAGHQNGGSWDADTHLFVLAADGSTEPAMVAPQTDRGLLVLSTLPAPYRWTGNREIAMLVADRGSVTLHTADVTAPVSREVLGGERQIDGFATARSPRSVVYTESWPDRPSEVWMSTLRGDDARQLSHMNDDFLAEVELGPVRRATAQASDGTEIEYFTISPPGPARRRLPVHLEIHGGPHGLWPTARRLAFHQSLAAAGYVVLLPNPRGSTSYGQRFTRACTGDWGGADCEDILSCCDDLVRRGGGDADRMFVSGGSYGGFMTAWIVGHTRRFRAATAVAAVIDQTSMILTTEIPDFCRFNFDGTPWDQPEVYRERSPLTYLPDVATPVLVVHWEGDLRVPIGQGEELYAGLRLLGKEAEFLRYPGGAHIDRSPSQAVDWVTQMLAWNERHDHPTRRKGS